MCVCVCVCVFEGAFSSVVEREAKKNTTLGVPRFYTYRHTLNSSFQEAAPSMTGMWISRGMGCEGGG